MTAAGRLSRYSYVRLAAMPHAYVSPRRNIRACSGVLSVSRGAWRKRRSCRVPVVNPLMVMTLFGDIRILYCLYLLQMLSLSSSHFWFVKFCLSFFIRGPLHSVLVNAALPLPMYSASMRHINAHLISRYLTISVVTVYE